MLRARGVGMQWISVTAQRTNRAPLIAKRLLEYVQFRTVVEHGQLAMRVTGVISRPQFDRSNIETRQFFENALQWETGQQRSEYAYSHACECS